MTNAQQTTISFARMNPNPPISVDSEGIKIEIETVGYVDEEVNIPATP